MMPLMAIIGVCLVLIFLLFAHPVQERLRAFVRRRPGLFWIAPAALWALFSIAAWNAGAAAPLLAVVAAYVALPAVLAWRLGRRKGADWRDLAAMFALWLPVEFSGGVAAMIPKAAQGYLHAVAYGIAILLGLWIFLIYRAFPGMKYDPPRSARDFANPVVAFALTAPVLIAIGLPLDFIQPFHWGAPAARIASRFALIFVATALPEEILFRSLIQNWMSQRWGETERTLIAASVLFGAAHLDNGPQAVPNWRYMILATIAGYAYGKVFRRSGTVVSSSLLHAMVDTAKHLFF